MKLAKLFIPGKTQLRHRRAEGVIDLRSPSRRPLQHLKALLRGNGLAQAARYLNDAVDVPMSAITFLPVIEQPEKNPLRGHELRRQAQGV